MKSSQEDQDESQTGYPKIINELTNLASQVQNTLNPIESSNGPKSSSESYESKSDDNQSVPLISTGLNITTVHFTNDEESDIEPTQSTSPSHTIHYSSSKRSPKRIRSIHHSIPSQERKSSLLLLSEKSFSFEITEAATLSIPHRRSITKDRESDAVVPTSPSLPPINNNDRIVADIPISESVKNNELPDNTVSYSAAPSAPMICTADPFGTPNDLDYRLHENTTMDNETASTDSTFLQTAQEVSRTYTLFMNTLSTYSRECMENFHSQLYSSEFENNQDFKSERIRNFLNVPIELEKFIFFAYFICLDSFLFIFTILPLRILLAMAAAFRAFLGGNKFLFRSAHKTDLLKGLLMIFCFAGLQFVDASRLYHSVRGQSVIKLYVIFGVLEICDKLCSAFGHDILDSLFSVSSHQSVSRRHISRLTRFVVASIYIFAHTIVLFYQVVTLNVAINSYNNALLTLLLSNQFSELKTSVFKRFEKENLFQLSCSEVVERFQLSVFLLIVTIRNYSEILGVRFAIGAWSSFIDLFMLWLRTSWYVGHVIFQYILSFVVEKGVFDEFHFLPHIVDSPEFKLAETLVTPVLVVFGTEMIVDWLKHAFITKFNNIQPSVYRKYRDSLCRDLLGIIGERGPSTVSTPLSPTGTDQSFSDRGPIVAKRLGFVSIPLASLVLKVFFQIIKDSEEYNVDDAINSSSSPEEDAVLIKRLSITLPQWMKSSGQLILWRTHMSPALGFLAGFLVLLLIKILVGTFLRRAAESILRHSMSQEKEAPIEVGFQFPSSSVWSPSLRSSTVDPLSQTSEQRSSISSLRESKVTPDLSPQKRRVTVSTGTKSPLRLNSSTNESLPDSPILKLVQEEQPTGSPKMEEKLDRIDRFTMVKSRII